MKTLSVLLILIAPRLVWPNWIEGDWIIDLETTKSFNQDFQLPHVWEQLAVSCLFEGNLRITKNEFIADNQCNKTNLQSSYTISTTDSKHIVINLKNGHSYTAWQTTRGFCMYSNKTFMVGPNLEAIAVELATNPEDQVRECYLKGFRNDA